MSVQTHADGLSRADVERAVALAEAVDRHVGASVVGQESLRRSLLVSLLTGGHLLVESVPGLAKTLAASTLAHAVGARFSRIQCTPDLLPSDIIGTQVYDPRDHSFSTQLGPVHANVVLLDEVNRASAKTQSALLEAMGEGHTSIAGVTHPLPRPFLVLATQNPLDEEGTYLLPQAQLDRFALKEVLDYPSHAEEVAVLDRVQSGELSAGVHGDAGSAHAQAPAIDLEGVRELQRLVRRVHVEPSVKDYVVRLVAATRDTASVLGAEPTLAAAVETGASPRASITFLNVARALALLAGRDHVRPDDVLTLAHQVLRHRLVLTFDAQADRVRPEDVVDAVVAAVPAP
ncbi:MoxR family ATPase [Nocardioides sp. GY 10127]|uniref:AAA family ATPase n=1 Tax=Nocardioides sp. GY 10127 TaxID=2569762 RepID=UPI001F0F4648|nr:MoxR family ATPase [Nocardioides sp. GY 10127]